jgi:putative peptide zinc metalloprotease protein
VTYALDARPRLQDEVKIVRREHRGAVHYIVKEPKEQKYFRFGELEVGLMRLMDGNRTPAEIAAAAEAELGLRPDAGQVADFAHKLKRLGIVERTPVEQHVMLMERLRSQRHVRARRRTKGSFLRIRFSIGDPDRLFQRVVERTRWAWSRAFVWGSVALFAVYTAILIANWDRFWSGTVGLYLLSGFGVWDWVLFYLLFLFIGGIHELGHGLTTKAFGGSVHEIGGMLLYFTPALFCNTNDAWTFEKRSHRLWVTFAGPWIELIIAALAAIVWVTTEPGTFVNKLAFLTVLSGGILAVLANLNPLLPLDGYYALSDWLEIPNLRRRAFEYTGWLGKRYVLGMDVAAPPATPRERRVFIIYGLSALAYSAVIAVVSLLWLIFVIGRFIGPWVWVIVAFIAGRSLARMARRGRALVGVATTTWRAGFLRSNRVATGLAVIVLLVLLPLLVPWTFRARGEFTVEAQPRAQIRAEVSGVIDRWYVREGEVVAAGEPLARLWNPALEAEVLELAADVARLELQRSQAEARGDRTTAASAGAALEELRDELEVAHARRERLRLTAPIDGIVLAHRLPERLGEAVAEGELLLEIAGTGGRRARVQVPAKDAGELAPGQRATLKLFARPELKFVSTVASVAPAARGGHVQVEVVLPADDWQPAPGTTGIAKIEMRRGTVAQAILRAVRRTVRIDLWL